MAYHHCGITTPFGSNSIYESLRENLEQFKGKIREIKG
jgi:hypothetical protein